MSDEKAIYKVLIYFRENTGLNHKIQNMAAAVGWKKTGGNAAYNILFFGYDESNARTKTILHDDHPGPADYVARNYPTRNGWTHINADTEWEKVEALFGPEFDATPLPYDMNPELQASTMAKFNLSQDQWDLMPLMVREALAGCEVKQQDMEYKWFPVTRPETTNRTVLLTRRIGTGNNAMNDNAIGYFESSAGGVRVRLGRITPEQVTHWCYLPGQSGAEETEDD